MNAKYLILNVGILLLTSLLLVGCGGGSESSSGNSATNNVIEGVASKGIIDGGIATAYAVNDDGTRGAELGSDQTDANGQYRIDLGNYNGPVLVEVTGGSYTDEATDSIVANIKLRAAVPAVNGNTKVAVTPLTEIAVQIAGATYNATRINNANAAVAILIGGADITTTQPPDIRGDLSGATPEEKNNTMVLAAISQMIEDGSASDVADAVAIIRDDIADDGNLAFNGNGTGSVIQGALGNFIASADNNTGLTGDDITLDEAIDSAAKYLIETEATDSNADGVVDRTTTYTYEYDAEGHMVMKQELNDRVGQSDMDYIYSYNNLGQLTGEVQYMQPDDVYGGTTTYIYDDAGNLTEKHIDFYDNGITDRLYIYTYDAVGNMILESDDRDNNGTPNTYKYYTYDAAGNQIMSELDTLANGSLDSRSIFTYDANGNMIMTEWDTHANDSVDQRYTYTCDADGNRIMEERDNNLDDIVDDRVTWTYDSYGNMDTYEFDSGANGTIDIIRTYTWVKQ